MTDASRKKQTFKLMSKKLILAVWVLILEEILAFRTLYSTGSDNEPIVGQILKDFSYRLYPEAKFKFVRFDPVCIRFSKSRCLFVLTTFAGLFYMILLLFIIQFRETLQKLSLKRH